MGTPSTLAFKKVNHPGCHQDYQIIWTGRHVGNIRAGFKNHAGRTIEWTARSDVGGAEVTVYARQQRTIVAMKLVMILEALGAGTPGSPTMQTTKDVGWDENPRPARSKRTARCTTRSPKPTARSALQRRT